MTSTPPNRSTPILAHIVQEHANEAAGLWTTRTELAAAPHVGLFDLARWDERLAAHLDGLGVAGEDGWPFCDSMLDDQSPGAMFVAAVRAIEDKRSDKLDGLFALAARTPETRSGLVAAFGWVERDRLRGTVAGLIQSENAFRRAVGIAACAMHRIDPGLTSGPWLSDPDPIVRARAFRSAGELGRHELLSRVTAALDDDDPDCRFWAGWSAVLLGDRKRAVDGLARIDTPEAPHRLRAFRLVLQALPTGEAHALLQRLGGDPSQIRWLIQGSGIVGDPTYVPWLIKQMADDNTSRLAGEAFTHITGGDLDALHLDRPRPENVEGEPTENPEDENVEMDPDDGLPWPDQQRVQGWWDANANRFPPGTRCFMGDPVTRARCIDVLKSGYQRQRILAANHLRLLDPGTPLFNTSAPAWRQQRLLAQEE